jgi:hypothetical protein
MIILSLNVKVVGDTHKKIALKRCFAKFKLDVILLEETMCEGKKVESLLSMSLKHWSFRSLDSKGRSRGIITYWKNTMDLTNLSFLPVGIKTE